MMAGDGAAVDDGDTVEGAQRLDVGEAEVVDVVANEGCCD